jgi:hypothetical protein
LTSEVGLVWKTKAGCAEAQPAFAIFQKRETELSMKKLGWALLAIVLALVVSGCGSDKDRGVNRDKDRPTAAKDADQ